MFQYFNSRMTDGDLSILKRGMLAQCDSTGEYFNIGEVEVTARYADCSMFKCPSCGNSHDDRVKWGARDSSVRNGFTMVKSDRV